MNCWTLLAACCLITVVAATLTAADENATTSLATTPTRIGKGVQVRGWTQINQLWPGSEPDYFIAVEKGHHFIQVRLPQRLESDLIVKLRYYYKHAKVRPFFQIVPCRTNVDILSERADSPAPGQWHEHSMRVKSSDCDRRKELAYNILLHDANDVFAWSSLEIRSVAEPELIDEPVPDSPRQPDSPQSQPEQREPEIVRPSSPEQRPASPEREPELPASPIQRPSSPERLPVQKEPEEEIVRPVSPENNRPFGPENRPASPEKQTEPEKEKDPEKEIDNRPTSPEKKPVEPEKEPERPASPIRRPVSPEAKPSQPEEKKAEPEKKVDDLSLDDIEQQFLPVSDAENEEPSRTKKPDEAKPNDRVKRSADWERGLARFTRASEEELDLVCKPRMCDRSLVSHPKFMKVIGAQALSNRPSGSAGQGESAQRQRMYINTDNGPLTFEISSDDDDLADNNLCFEFWLYLDANTNMSWLLDETDHTGATKQKLLEVFEARPELAARWNRIQRCISDYMPRLKSGGEESKPIHKLKLSMLPKSSAPEREKVLVSLDREQMVSKKINPRPLAYIQDALNVPRDDARALSRMWILDHDVAIESGEGPKFEFAHLASTSTDPFGGKVLRVNNIGPKQEHFDLTSRWIKVDDPEVLDAPVLFNYKADRADWVKALDFEFQNADHDAQQWRSERIYTRAPLPPQTTNGTQADPAAGIAAPIRIKGLNKKEFRVRLRHHVDETLANSGPDLHQLTIRKLAFGDACAMDQPYCLNGGQCAPTGVSRAKCTCRRGYSGKHCEVSRPCDVLYAGGLSGSDLCRSLGARCVENIPIFKCIWPDDKYYQCKALALTVDGETVIPGQDPSGGAPVEGEGRPLSDSEKLKHLEAAANKQKQLLIVMGVFMAALMLFALVIVVNMIAKLRKSNKRLKTAQIEVHELTRQYTPGTSSSLSGTPRSMGGSMGVPVAGPAFHGRPNSRNKPAAVLAYNNRAFDAANQ